MSENHKLHELCRKKKCIFQIHVKVSKSRWLNRLALGSHSMMSDLEHVYSPGWDASPSQVTPQHFYQVALTTGAPSLHCESAI